MQGRGDDEVGAVRPVDALGPGAAGVALALVGVLSLVLLMAPDIGTAGLLSDQRHAVGFLWQWRLVGLAAAATLFVLSDGGASLRRPEGSSTGWVRTVSLVWLVLVAVGTFGTGGGAIERLWTSFPVVVTTVVFTLGHLQGYGFDAGETFRESGYVWTNGLVYGVLRARTGSIWPSVAVHSAGNAIALLAGSV